MADLKLDLLFVPTYTVMTLGVMDASVYPDPDPIVANPLLTITPPGFPPVSIPFVIQELNLLDSTDLEITELGGELPLPDRIYYFRYSIEPASTNFVEKTIVRVDNLQEKFDNAFMGLDFMECDSSIKKQATVQLNTVYLLMQGAIAAANNCAPDQAVKLYTQADKMLNKFLANGCGGMSKCSC